MDIYCKLANHLWDHIKIRVIECKISYFKSTRKNCKALIYQNTHNGVVTVFPSDIQYELHNEMYLIFGSIVIIWVKYSSLSSSQNFIYYLLLPG